MASILLVVVLGVIVFIEGKVYISFSVPVVITTLPVISLSVLSFWSSFKFTNVTFICQVCSFFPPSSALASIVYPWAIAKALVFPVISNPLTSLGFASSFLWYFNPGTSLVISFPSGSITVKISSGLLSSVVYFKLLLSITKKTLYVAVALLVVSLAFNVAIAFTPSPKEVLDPSLTVNKIKNHS